MIVVRFGNARLQTFRVLDSGRCLRGIDMGDDFGLVRKGDGTVSVDLNGAGVPNQEENRLRFANFVSRVNQFPSTFDLSPVLRPLVQALCVGTAEANPAKPDIVPLYYLVPINARESFWSALASRPFMAAGARIEPWGFLDEMLLILCTACVRVAEAHLEPPFDLYVIFQVTQVSVACRVLCRQSGESFTMQPAEIFPVHDPVLRAPDATQPGVIFRIEDQLVSKQNIEPLLEFFRNAPAGPCTVNDLGSATWEDVLNIFFSGANWTADPALELHLSRHIGLCDGMSFRHVINSATNQFPLFCSTNLQMGPWERERQVTFFRGYFPSPDYCYCFNPIQLPAGHSHATYRVSVTLEDLETARVEFSSAEGAQQKVGIACSRDLLSPPSLFSERNLT